MLTRRAQVQLGRVVHNADQNSKYVQMPHLNFKINLPLVSVLSLIFRLSLHLQCKVHLPHSCS